MSTTPEFPDDAEWIWADSNLNHPGPFHTYFALSVRVMSVHDSNKNVVLIVEPCYDTDPVRELLRTLCEARFGTRNVVDDWAVLEQRNMHAKVRIARRTKAAQKS